MPLRFPRARILASLTLEVVVVVVIIVFGIGPSAGAGVVSIAGWVLFGASCLLFAMAEIHTHRSGTRPAGGVGYLPILVALQLGLGIAATAGGNLLLAIMFVASVLGPPIAVYNKMMDRRAGIHDEPLT